MKTTQEEILLAPSSLSYDWEECQACFHARAVHGERKPPLTMPSIFSKIDSRMKASLTGRELSELVPGAPQGVLGEGGSIKAAPWRAEPQHRPIVLRGYPDTLIHVEGDDGSNQVIVGDYKTVVPSAKTAARYKTQLESYAFALEHPAKGEPVKVAGLGLLCYSPDAFAVVPPSDNSPVTGRLDGSFVWIPLDYDEKRYLAFLGKVAAVLNGPPPAPTEGCLGCEMRRLRALEKKVHRVQSHDMAHIFPALNRFDHEAPTARLVAVDKKQARNIMAYVESLRYKTRCLSYAIPDVRHSYSLQEKSEALMDMDNYYHEYEKLRKEAIKVGDDLKRITRKLNGWSGLSSDWEKAGEQALLHLTLDTQATPVDNEIILNLDDLEKVRVYVEALDAVTLDLLNAASDLAIRLKADLEKRPAADAGLYDIWQSLRALIEQPPDDMTLSERDEQLTDAV
jgi:hypothetical protein